jgi:hypothetical protein
MDRSADAGESEDSTIENEVIDGQLACQFAVSTPFHCPFGAKPV